MYKKRIESLHDQIQKKAVAHWLREAKGRFHCLVFGSPEKPKLQAKENFLVAHMHDRNETPSFDSAGRATRGQ